MLPQLALFGGGQKPLHWHRVKVEAGDNTLKIVYRTETPSLEARSIWAGSGADPVEHRLELVNRSSDVVELNFSPTLSLGLHARPTLFDSWVEKGAGGPSSIGVHREVLGTRVIRSTAYSEDAKRDAIPWAVAEDPATHRGLYVGVEFSGLTSIALRNTGGILAIRSGIDAGPDDRTRLAPGARYTAPAVFIGSFRGDLDDASFNLKDWLLRRIVPKVSETRYPLLTLNSWGSGMAIDASMARTMSADAARLGLEMFHIDAGWFRSVGDWRPDPAKFPKGLRAVSDYVHGLGLKFGLWVGWTQGGIGDASSDPARTLNVFDPGRRDWFARPPAPGWKPQDFTGSTVCLADPDAATWCFRLLQSVVSEYKLDMLEHDQHIVVSQCVQPSHRHLLNGPDISQAATQSYYGLYDRLRQQYPALLFEDCVDGGRMVDFGVVRRVSYVSISDTYTPVPNRQAFYDASFAIPAAMCECYVSDRQAPLNDADFLTMLRSGMMGWFTLMQDPRRWSAHWHELAAREFRLYKQRLRPLIRNGRLFHALARPTGARWDGVQYASTDGRHGAVFAFRSYDAAVSKMVPIRGLAPSARYRVTFPNEGGQPLVFSGRELMRRGLRVHAHDEDGSTVALIDVVASHLAN
jgi:hypothetical protein